MRAIPGQGLGFELLRDSHPEADMAIAEGPRPQIAFRYVGRLADDIDEDWSASHEAACLFAGSNPEMPLDHLLEVSAVAADDHAEGPLLAATWRWSAAHLDDADAQALADGWKRALEALVRHTELPNAGGHTPADFPLVRLSQSQVEDLETACPDLEDVLPLAPLQEGLLFHALRDAAGHDVYNIQIVLKIEGVLDAGRLRSAAEALLHRHANLRVAFHHQGIPIPVQVVTGQIRFPWREWDLSSIEEEPRNARLKQLLLADWSERFVPSSPPLLRWTLVRLGSERHMLIFTSHHILVDGWSLPIFIGELLDCYRDNGQTDALPRGRPYTDYLAWLARQDHTAAIGAWRDYLAGVEVPTRLGSSIDPAQPVVAPRRWSVKLPVKLTAELVTMARTRGLTLNTVVQGLWGLLLGRMTARDDVVFGITVSGRPAELAGIERMVGLFINTVPLRIRLRPGDTLAGLLAGVQESQSRLLAFQHVGLAEIQHAAGAGELFDTLVVFENFLEECAACEQRGMSLRVSRLEGRDATHYPLSLIVVPGERLHLRLDYDPTRFSRQTAETIGGRFVRLLEAAAAYPDSPLHRLDVLDAAERQTLVKGFSATTRPLPEATIPELFKAQVTRKARAIAIIDGERSLSYGELNIRANRLAHRLIEMGVGPETLIGVCLDRSALMVTALVAIWKAGAALLPLDAEYPKTRLSGMVADARPRLVISTNTMRDRLPKSVEILALDDETTQRLLDRQPENNPTDANRPCPLGRLHPAYVIYTSGSTGIPKGVVADPAHALEPHGLAFARRGTAGRRPVHVAKFRRFASRGLTRVARRQDAGDRRRRDSPPTGPICGVFCASAASPISSFPTLYSSMSPGPPWSRRRGFPH